MIKEQLSSLDQVQLNLGSGTGLVMSIVLALIMFGIALGIKGKVLKDVFVHPKSILTGVILQWIGLPLVTFLLIVLFNHWLTPMVALGMLLVGSCPGGNISNFMSSLSKANVELSVSLTAVTTALAVFTTPFNFWLWGNLYINSLGVAADIPHLSIPLLDVFKTIFILLGIPLSLGILTSQYLPKVADKLKKPFQWLSIIFFIAMATTYMVSFSCPIMCIFSCFSC